MYNNAMYTLDIDVKIGETLTIHPCTLCHSASPRSPAAGELRQQSLPRDVEEVLLLRNVDTELAGVLLKLCNK